MPATVHSSSTADSASPQRNTSSRVVVVTRRQHHDLGAVVVDGGAALAPACRRKRRDATSTRAASELETRALSRHLHGVGARTVMSTSAVRPDTSRVVAAQRLGEPGCLRQLSAASSSATTSSSTSYGWTTARAAPPPVRARRPGRRTVTGRCGVDGSQPPAAGAPRSRLSVGPEPKCGQMVGLGRVGKALGGAVPAGSGHGHPR